MKTPEPVALGLRLGLLSLLLKPVGMGAIRPALVAVAAAGLVVPGLLRSPALWLLLASLCGLRVVVDWPLSDNHAYLLAYFCLAVGVSRLARDPEAALAWNARLLIGLAFLFAVAWKLASPDFLDGRFFRVSLFVDPRLEAVARIGGGLDAHEIAAWREHLTTPLDASTPPPPEPGRLRALVAAMTWGALAIEVAVALAFLWPPPAGASRLRDPLLLGFCVTTYALAPVAGFGWLVLALGLVQGDPAQRWRPWAYLATFALVFAYRLRFDGLLGGI